MANPLSSLLKVILPKRRANERGTSYTNTYDPSQTDQTLTAPTYREHVQDIFTQRTISDSRALLSELFKHDSDASATVNAYLTVANTEPLFFVYDQENKIDREGHKTLDGILQALTTRLDYSTGFRLMPSLRTIAENMRYMVLLRGGIGAEAVFDKTLILREIRNVDLATIEWFEKSPGQYTPIQSPTNANEEINLDIPTFFVAFYRRDPTTIYPHSPFVSAINTIAARQQVINDLYRIMQKTGYPRISVEVLEEVLRKNAPAQYQQDEDKMREWLNQRLTQIGNQLSTMRVDQVFAHFDSVKPSVFNKDGPGKSMDVTSIINVLNAQNQAALKVMSTIIGRGESGVNTASTEARIFSMNAEEVNEPVAEILSHIFTLALRMTGSVSRVEVKFAKVELRPELELEPQLTMKQARLLELLSHGLITDDQFHIEMFNRIRPDEIAELSGSGFMQSAKISVDATKISPNADPMGRSLSAPGSRSARSNTVKK